MIEFLSRLFADTPPSILDAGPRDASSLAALHAAAFGRGWTEQEFEGLLADRNVVAQRAMAGGRLVGFIVSRLAADEAEILSVAVAHSSRGRGVAGALLDHHLGRLAGLGTGKVFLEVNEDNAPARKLYRRRHFREIGRREGYYPAPSGAASRALVLRRDLG